MDDGIRPSGLRREIVRVATKFSIPLVEDAVLADLSLEGPRRRGAPTQALHAAVPADSIVEVAGFYTPEAQIEIEAIAVIGSERAS